MSGKRGIRKKVVIMKHIPVLLDEVIARLNPQPSGKYIDATVGDGGHADALLKHSHPTGKLLGLDQDVKQVEVARERLRKYDARAKIVVARFSGLEKVAQSHGFSEVDGILFDLGYSSRQISDPNYGLDYLSDDSPLDMRLAQDLEFNAADFLNRGNEREIADVLFRFGDRHASRILAQKIIQFRRKSKFQVARDVKTALNIWKPGELAPIFQALRIWVNQEFSQIETALPQAINLLKPGGNLVVITFHSGEDRVVKQLLKAHRNQLEVSTKIVLPSYAEIKSNSRARSAKLRHARKK